MTKKYGISGIGADVEFGKGGARFTSTAADEFAARNTGDSDYARILAGHPTGTNPNEVITLKYLEDNYLFKITWQIDGNSPDAGTPANGEVGIVTTAASGYSLTEVYERIAGAWVIKPLVDGLIGVVEDDLTGGTDEYLGQHDYKYDADTPVWIDYGVTSAVTKVYKRERGSVVFGDGTSVNIGAQLPIDARITGISFNVTAVFDGTAPTLTLGDGTTADLYSTNADLDLTTTGLYKIDNFAEITALTQVEATFNSDSSTTGNVDIEIQYSI